MSEKTAKTVSVKVSQATYDSLNDEQNRVRKERGYKPTFQELLDEAWHRAIVVNHDENRLPEELVNVFRKEIDRYQETGQATPSIAELVSKAWEYYVSRRQGGPRPAQEKEQVTGGSSSTIAGDAKLDSVDSSSGIPDDVIELSHRIAQDDVPWVEKLLKVLHSGKEKFQLAVQSNLDVFAGYCDLEVPEGHGSAAAAQDVEQSDARTKSGSTRQTRKSH